MLKMLPVREKKDDEQRARDFQKSHHTSEVKSNNIFIDQIQAMKLASLDLFRIDVSRVDSLEGGDGDVGDVGVQLVDAVLVFVTLAGESDTHSDGDALDTLGPKMFVQAGIDTDILRSHLLLGKVTDRLDGPGSAPLGTDTEDALVHVNGVLASDDLIDRTLALLLGFLRCWRHFLSKCLVFLALYLNILILNKLKLLN